MYALLLLEYYSAKYVYNLYSSLCPIQGTLRIRTFFDNHFKAQIRTLIIIFRRRYRCKERTDPKQYSLNEVMYFN